MKKSIIALSLGFILFAACTDNDDSITVEDRPTSAEFHNLFDLGLQHQTQTFQMDAAQTITFTSTKGVQFTVNGTCLTLNGNPVTGQVDLEYVEVFDGGSMLATNKTTMGVMPDGDKAMLVSGGEFYINATKNGQQLDISCPISLIIPTSLTNPGGLNVMTLWVGAEDADGNVTWEEADDTAGGNGVGIEGQGPSATYYAFASEFGWTNVDCFYNNPDPKTTILASVPSGYNNENCAIYLHYDGLGNGLAYLDTYDSNTGLFSEHYGQIPIGLACHIIFVTEENGQWRYAIKGVTISANAVYNFTLAETTVGSESQLIAAINALP
nr:hypothetical protein [uncultured Flavobacterium sp.]